MISIRKYLEGIPTSPPTPPPPSWATAGWRRTLAAVALNIEQAVPLPGAETSSKLNSLARKIDDRSGQAVIDGVAAEVDAELKSWSSAARGLQRRRDEEVREIVATLARLGEAVGARDQRYVTQFGDLTVRLRAAARLDDLSSVRRSIVQSASEISACTTKLREEGERNAAELRQEVEQYRVRLEDSERRALTDSMTGLSNRDGIETQLQLRMAPAANNWRDVCVIVLDLNGFKAVNDQYGHPAGDQLLKLFGAELKSHFRSIDLVGRCGGDEFIVVTDSAAADAQRHYARLRRWALGNYTIEVAGQPVKVDVRASIGLALWNGTGSMPELIARADAAMYEDKKSTTGQSRLAMDERSPRPSVTASAQLRA